MSPDLQNQSTSSSRALLRGWRALRSRSGLGAVAALMAIIGGLAACGGGQDVVARVGRTLEVHVGKPQIVEKVAFLDGDGRHRVIRPRASNRQLAAVEVTVVNRTTTIIPLLVDSEAARLGDRRGDRIGALDPFEAKLTEAPDVDEDKYTPLLWGAVELGRHFQVSGWLLFDVPKGMTLGTVWWDEVDTILLDYIDYQRNRPNR